MRHLITICLMSCLWLALPAHTLAQMGPSITAPSIGERTSSGFIADGGPAGSPGQPLATVKRAGSGRPEIVLVGPDSQIATVREALASIGATALRTRRYPALERVSLTIDLHRGMSIRDLNQWLAGIAPGVRADEHALYRFAQGTPRLYAPAMLGMARPDSCRVPGSLRIGLIDGPVDTSHPALQKARIHQQSALSANEYAAGTNHGTAVAALIVGTDDSGQLSGFAPGAELFAVNTFGREGGAAAAGVERIGAAFDWLVASKVNLINMSFAGPPNAVLDDLISAVAARGVVMIAAAGNEGKQIGAYPAAADVVIAVTAVDAASRLYRSANFGAHIEFAAPGVDLYVARQDGADYASGTSYAAPIVTALAAQLMARGAHSASAVRRGLRDLSIDLGDQGRDSRFGWGLVRAPRC